MTQKLLVATFAGAALYLLGSWFFPPPSSPQEVPEARAARPQEVRPGWSALRRQGNDFLMGFYRLPSVQKACQQAREVLVPFDGPGHEITVDCVARRQLLELVVLFYRSPEVATACAATPSGEVTVTASFGTLPVNCRLRTSDLALIEPWL